MNFRRNYRVLIVLLWHWSGAGNRSMIWRDCHNKLSFLGISCGENEWKPPPNWSWINKIQGKLSKDIVRPIFQCFILIFPLGNKGDLCVFPLSNKPFHVCIGEIQVFLDGPTGNPKKCLLCVVAVDFVASSCTSQIYKRTANSLSVRSVAVFQKKIKKREIDEVAEKSPQQQLKVTRQWV